MPRIITLTTDFGLEDEYVGVMKGVILGRAPESTIVDLSHTIERQDIRQAAMLIRSAYRYFPAGTIHLIVVDPGVGSNRKLILLLAEKQLFLAPDNGVLGFLLDSENFESVYEIQCPRYYMTPVSTTFHGRDILAPVAAELARGISPTAVGPAIDHLKLQRIRNAPPKIDREHFMITGEITGRDHFGNLQTSIAGELLDSLYGKAKNRVNVFVRGVTITGIVEAFAHRGAGELLAVVGSRDSLEIAVNKGNAAKRIGAEIGDEVRVTAGKPQS
ncbi:MAG: SAM hydrolase/SAM-dependent halogenase family protein [Desulfobulbales bacterium]